jgi:hypothetical protein
VLRELYAYYARTEGMYTSLLRDELLVPAVRERLAGFHGFLGATQDILVTGRGLRGGAAKRTRAAIGHALAFTTWRSLTREQGLSDADAAGLMCALAEDAGATRPSAHAA